MLHGQGRDPFSLLYFGDDRRACGQFIPRHRQVIFFFFLAPDPFFSQANCLFKSLPSQQQAQVSLPLATSAPHPQLPDLWPVFLFQGSIDSGSKKLKIASQLSIQGRMSHQSVMVSQSSQELIHPEICFPVQWLMGKLRLLI